MPGTAIVVGYNGLGGVKYLSELLQRYGFETIYALVDRRSGFPSLNGVPTLEVIEVADILNAEALAETVRAIAGYREVPFICIQDRVMFSYLSARQLLYGAGETRYHVPSDGIMRARIKPAARLCWNRTGIESTRWTVISEDKNVTSRWSEIGGLGSSSEGPYIVKPICGTASEMVTKQTSWTGVEKAVDTIRRYFDATGLAGGSHRIQEVDGERYDLYQDVLVEEFLQGAEYTIDGFAAQQDVSVVVQHKETVWSGKFFGDGGIYAPPDNSLETLDAQPPLQFTARPTTTPAEFDEFARTTVRSLGLTNWSFHGEGVVTGDQRIHLMELNPRSPGGLLWRTAAFHLGIDPVELIVRSHLRIPSFLVKRGWVTAQFPIYADRKGVIKSIDGVDEARTVKYVEHVQVVKWPEDVIVNDVQENYAALVCIHAPDHVSARDAEKKVRSIIHVVYKS